MGLTEFPAPPELKSERLGTPSIDTVRDGPVHATVLCTLTPLKQQLTSYINT
jgi:hypothetical protein